MNRTMSERTLTLLAFICLPLLSGCLATARPLHGPAQVVGLVKPCAASGKKDGKLVVSTDTLEHEEELFTYSLHRPYDLFDRDGEFLRRVRNHIGAYDESPMRISLPEGTYRIRTQASDGEVLVVEVELKSERVTYVDIDEVRGRADARPTVAEGATAGSDDEAAR